MMGPLSRTVLISLASLGALSSPASLAAEAPAPTAETARRQQAMRDAMHELQEARLAYTAKKYSDAVEHYRKSLAYLPKGDATAKQLTFIKDSLSDALIAKAIDYRSVGRTEEALEFLAEAIELSPDNKRARQVLAHTQDPVRTNPALSPQHLADVEEVQRLLTLGQGNLALGRYDAALENFHAVRRIDATNEAAIRGIEQVHKRRSSYGTAAYDAYRAKALSEVDKQWEEGAEVAPDGLASQLGSSSDVQNALDSELQGSFSDSLDKMVMPQIVFEDATISEVIETLQNQVRRFEASGVAAGRPINISSNFGAPSSKGYKELMEKRVNLKLHEVSMRAVLDILTTQLGLSYYFTPVGVELSYSGKDFGPLVERSFTVPPHFFDAAKDESAGVEDDEDDAFADSSSKVAVRRVNPVQALKAMGITFPEGATARYAPSTRTLHVRNTAHNIAEVQELLNVPIDEARQVIFNVIVMQMNENELEELGFDWLVKVGFGGEMFGGGGTEKALSAATGLPLMSPMNEAEGDSLTEGLRSGREVINQSGMDELIEVGSAQAFANRKDTPAPGIFSLRGVWSAADAAVIMRGLSLKKGVDILQNPQIVFSPGFDEQVQVACVRELFYPEDYEQGEISSTTFNRGNNNVNNNNDDDDADEDGGDDNNAGHGRNNNVTVTVATSAHPSSFTRFGMNEDEVGGIGTILQVHSADMTEDGRFLNLAFTTTVTDFEGFINWGSPIKSVLIEPQNVLESTLNTALNGPQSNVVEIVLSPNYILKPIFKRHLVNNSLTVAPGAVLVFAGLKESKKIRYEDKVPVLGDLPLVGRFFRSEGSQNTRKVLLYLAKVDVVDPAGRDVRTGKRPGRLLETQR